MAPSMWTTAVVWSCLWMVTSCQDSITYSVTEQVPIGTFVGNVAADVGLWDHYDIATMQDLRYRFLEPVDENMIYFTINDISSVIQIAQNLDRDELCPRQAECQIQQDTAAVSPDGHFHVFTVIFSIQDINDNWPIFPQQAVRIEIAESASVGSLYNLPLAQDLDSTEFGIQQYALNASDHFSLVVNNMGSETTTVQLSVSSHLDRETRDFYQLVLYAYDGGSPPHSASLLLNVSVSDANDHGPVFPNSTVSVWISESTPLYSVIATVRAEDADMGENAVIRYSVSTATDVAALGALSVDAASGDVILEVPLDYESRASLSVILEARDGGENSQPGYCTLVVYVLDVNDNPPEIIINTLTGTPHAEISENQEAGRFVAHLTIRDSDQGPGGQFQCTIGDPHFELSPLEGNRYEIITTETFDREEEYQYFVDILCEDFGVPFMSSSKQILVSVTDENDNPPQFSQTVYEVFLDENNPMETSIMQMNASDEDLDRNGDIRYIIDDSAQDLVTIDFMTGVVRANAVFDFEEITELTFEVIAMDNGISSLSSTCTVTLFILDINDEPPTFPSPEYGFMVMENRPSGLEIGRVQATDGDSYTFSQIEYVILSGDGLFTIDSSSGHIRTDAELDREEQETYMLTVLAVNQGVMPPLSGSTLVAVTVMDENDNTPRFMFPNYNNHSLHISNQIPAGSEVGWISASDGDKGANSRLEYSVSGGNEGDTFMIDPDTGAITTNVPLQRYEVKLFEILVSVSDHGTPTNTANGILYIQVNSSLAYTSTGNSLLGPNNITIVIVLAICSVVIITVLIVAIALMRSRDLRKRAACQHHYHVNIRASLGHTREVGGVPSREPDGSSHRGSVDSPSQVKDCSFFEEPQHGLQAHRVGLTHSNSKTQYDKVNQSQSITKAIYQGCDVTVASDTEKPASSDRPKMTSLKRSSAPGATPSTPWELSTTNLQTQVCAWPATSDTDSAYSGDISNADSGRGTSEFGDHNSSGASHQIHPPRPPSRRHPHPSQPAYPGPPVASRAPPPTVRPKYHHPPITRDSAATTANADTSKPPLPSRKGRPKSNATCPRNGCPSNHPNPYWKGNRCHGPPSEDDGDSTTSGSYVVDAADLDLDPSGQLVSAVTV